MFDPFNNEKRYLIWSFILIIFSYYCLVWRFISKVYPVSKVNIGKVEEILDELKVNNLFIIKKLPLNPEETMVNTALLK